MRLRRNADCPRSPYIREGSLECPIVIEDLEALVPTIAHVHITLGVSRDRMRRVKLTWRRPSRSPGLEEPAILVEFRDPRVAIAIGYENVSGCVPGHVGRPIENVAGHAGA